MPSIFRRTIMYLGLAPEGAYEDSYEGHLSAPEMQSVQDQMAYQPPVEPDYEMEGVSNVNPYSAQPAASNAGTLYQAPNNHAPGYSAPGYSAPNVAPTPSAGGESNVRSVASGNSSPVVVAPNVFDDAQHVADRFLVGQPIILNLQGLERDLARRFLDFASGLCYGLGGEITKVANQVYLLVPAGVELSEEDRNQVEQPGFRR